MKGNKSLRQKRYNFTFNYTYTVIKNRRREKTAKNALHIDHENEESNVGERTGDKTADVRL